MSDGTSSDVTVQALVWAWALYSIMSYINSFFKTLVLLKYTKTSKNFKRPFSGGGPCVSLTLCCLWFTLRSDLFYVLPCVILFLCFSVLLAWPLSVFRMFVWFVLVLICRFPLPLGVWEGLRFVIVALPGLFSYLLFSVTRTPIARLSWLIRTHIGAEGNSSESSRKKILRSTLRNGF